MTDDAPQKKSLSERSSEEKTALAGGVAALVMVVLFAGWTVFFFKKVSRGNVTPTFDNKVQDEFNLESVRKAQADLSEMYKETTEEFRTLRDAPESSAEMQFQELVPEGEAAGDVFDVPQE